MARWRVLTKKKVCVSWIFSMKIANIADLEVHKVLTVFFFWSKEEGEEGCTADCFFLSLGVR